MRTGTSLAGQTPKGERVWPARLHGYGQLARTCCVVLNCCGLCTAIGEKAAEYKN